MVPEGSRDSEGDIVVLEMVIVMVDLLEVEMGGGRGSPVVQIVVDAVIQHVAKQLPTTEGTEDRPWEGIGVDEIEEANDGDCGDRGEDQSTPVHRSLVVDPMEKEVEDQLELAIWRGDPMEDESMEEVFSQSPCQYSEGEEGRPHDTTRQQPHRVVEMGERYGSEDSHNGQPYHRNHEPRCSSQTLQEIGVEQSQSALVGLMNPFPIVTSQ